MYIESKFKIAEAYGTVVAAFARMVVEAVAKAELICPAPVPAAAKPPCVKRMMFLDVYVRVGQPAMVVAAVVMAVGRAVAEGLVEQHKADGVEYMLQHANFPVVLTADASCWVLTIEAVSTTTPLAE
jgi:hypothetical protein